MTQPATSPPAGPRYCIIAFLSKSPSKTLDEFRDYYEHSHIPLVLRTVRAALPAGMAFPALVYTRRYLDSQNPVLTASGEFAGFDCMTELQFASKEAFEKYWIAALGQGDAGKAIEEDEARFLNRARTMAYRFEMHQTNGDKEDKI
jgi:hypothetical protein